MTQSTEVDILKSVEKLKAVIDSCQVENYRIMNQLRNFKFSKTDPFPSVQARISGAGGDTADVNRNLKSSRMNLHIKLTHKEHLSKLIKEASEENLKLRESNVKLKQESKVQDQKIRDLNHKMKQHERNLHDRESQKILIDDLKDSLDKKNGEIRRLRKNLDDVKVLSIKEQYKAKVFKEQQRNSVLKSKMSREIKSKVESLLLQIDLLLKDQDQANPIVYFSDSYFNKIQTVLNKLVFMKSKMTKRDLKAVPNVENSIGNNYNETEMLCSKTEKGIQVSGISTVTESLNLTDFTGSEIKIYSSSCLNENSSSSVAVSEMRHGRSKSI